MKIYFGRTLESVLSMNTMRLLVSCLVLLSILLPVEPRGGSPWVSYNGASGSDQSWRPNMLAARYLRHSQTGRSMGLPAAVAPRGGGPSSSSATNLPAQQRSVPVPVSLGGPLNKVPMMNNNAPNHGPHPPSMHRPQQGPMPNRMPPGPIRVHRHPQPNPTPVVPRTGRDSTRLSRPVSQHAGQLYDSWPNSNTHHHLAPPPHHQHQGPMNNKMAPVPSPKSLPHPQQHQQPNHHQNRPPPPGPHQRWQQPPPPANHRPHSPPPPMQQSNHHHNNNSPSKQQQQQHHNPNQRIDSASNGNGKEPTYNDRIKNVQNTLTALAKLSPQKPIMIFMKQEGVAATRAGADPAEVVKKFAGSSKIPFFNGTVPYSTLPPVFLAPDDMPMPYGYGKIPIPNLQDSRMKSPFVTSNGGPPTKPKSNEPFIAPATMNPPPGYTKVLLPHQNQNNNHKNSHNNNNNNNGDNGVRLPVNQPKNTKTLENLTPDEKMKIIDMLKKGDTKVIAGYRPNPNGQQNGPAQKPQENKMEPPNRLGLPPPGPPMGMHTMEGSDFNMLPPPLPPFGSHHHHHTPGPVRPMELHKPPQPEKNQDFSRRTQEERRPNPNALPEHMRRPGAQFTLPKVQDGGLSPKELEKIIGAIVSSDGSKKPGQSNSGNNNGNNNKVPAAAAEDTKDRYFPQIDITTASPTPAAPVQPQMPQLQQPHQGLPQNFQMLQQQQQPGFPVMINGQQHFLPPGMRPQMLPQMLPGPVQMPHLMPHQMQMPQQQSPQMPIQQQHPQMQFQQQQQHQQQMQFQQQQQQQQQMQFQQQQAQNQMHQQMQQQRPLANSGITVQQQPLVHVPLTPQVQQQQNQHVPQQQHIQQGQPQMMQQGPQMVPQQHQQQQMMPNQQQLPVQHPPVQHQMVNQPLPQGAPQLMNPQHQQQMVPQGTPVPQQMPQQHMIPQGSPMPPQMQPQQQMMVPQGSPMPPQQQVPQQMVPQGTPVPQVPQQQFQPHQGTAQPPQMVPQQQMIPQGSPVPPQQQQQQQQPMVPQGTVQPMQPQMMMPQGPSQQPFQQQQQPQQMMPQVQMQPQQQMVQGTPQPFQQQPQMPMVPQASPQPFQQQPQFQQPQMQHQVPQQQQQFVQQQQMPQQFAQQLPVQQQQPVGPTQQVLQQASPSQMPTVHMPSPSATPAAAPAPTKPHPPPQPSAGTKIKQNILKNNIPGKIRNTLQSALKLFGLQSTARPDIVMGKPLSQPPPHIQSRPTHKPMHHQKKQKKDRRPPKPSKADDEDMSGSDDSASEESSIHEVSVEAPPSAARRHDKNKHKSSSSKASSASGSEEPERRHHDQHHQQQQPTIIISGDGHDMSEINRIINSLHKMEETEKSDRFSDGGSPAPKIIFHNTPTPASAPNPRPIAHSTTTPKPQSGPPIIIGDRPLHVSTTAGPVLFSSTGRPLPIIGGSTAAPPVFVSSTTPFPQGIRTTAGAHRLVPILNTTPRPQFFIQSSTTPRPQLINLQPGGPTPGQQFIIQSSTGRPHLVTLGPSAVTPGLFHNAAVQQAIRQMTGISPTPFAFNPSTTPQAPRLVTLVGPQGQRVSPTAAYGTSTPHHGLPSLASVVNSLKAAEAAKAKANKAAAGSSEVKPTNEYHTITKELAQQIKSSKDKTIEKVVTEDRIIWSVLPSSGEGPTKFVPSNVHTEQRYILRPSSGEVQRPSSFESKEKHASREVEAPKNPTSSEVPTSMTFGGLLKNKVKFDKLRDKIYPKQPQVVAPTPTQIVHHQYTPSPSPVSPTVYHNLVSSTAGQLVYQHSTTTTEPTTPVDPNGRHKIRPGDLKSGGMISLASITPSSIDPSLLRKQHESFGPTAQSHFNQYNSPSPTAPAPTKPQEKLVFLPSKSPTTAHKSHHRDSEERLVLIPSNADISSSLFNLQPIPLDFDSSFPQLNSQLNGKASDPTKVIEENPTVIPTVETQPTTQQQTSSSSSSTTIVTTLASSPSTPEQTTFVQTSVPTTQQTQPQTQTTTTTTSQQTQPPTPSAPAPTQPYQPSVQPVTEDQVVTWRPNKNDDSHSVHSEQYYRNQASSVGAGMLHAMSIGLTAPPPQPPKLSYNPTGAPHSHQHHNQFGASVLYAMANGSPAPPMTMNSQLPYNLPPHMLGQYQPQYIIQGTPAGPSVSPVMAYYNPWNANRGQQQQFAGSYPSPTPSGLHVMQPHQQHQQPQIQQSEPASTSTTTQEPFRPSEPEQDQTDFEEEASDDKPKYRNRYRGSTEAPSAKKPVYVQKTRENVRHKLRRPVEEQVKPLSESTEEVLVDQSESEDQEPPVKSTEAPPRSRRPVAVIKTTEEMSVSEEDERPKVIRQFKKPVYTASSTVSYDVAEDEEAQEHAHQHRFTKVENVEKSVSEKKRVVLRRRKTTTTTTAAPETEEEVEQQQAASSEQSQDGVRRFDNAPVSEEEEVAQVGNNNKGRLDLEAPMIISAKTVVKKTGPLYDHYEDLRWSDHEEVRQTKKAPTTTTTTTTTPATTTTTTTTTTKKPTIRTTLKAVKPTKATTPTKKTTTTAASALEDLEDYPSSELQKMLKKLQARIQKASGKTPDYLDELDDLGYDDYYGDEPPKPSSTKKPAKATKPKKNKSKKGSTKSKTSTPKPTKKTTPKPALKTTPKPTPKKVVATTKKPVTTRATIKTTPRPTTRPTTTRTTTTTTTPKPTTTTSTTTTTTTSTTTTEAPVEPIRAVHRQTSSSSSVSSEEHPAPSWSYPQNANIAAEQSYAGVSHRFPTLAQKEAAAAAAASAEPSQSAGVSSSVQQQSQESQPPAQKFRIRKRPYWMRNAMPQAQTASPTPAYPPTTTYIDANGKKKIVKLVRRKKVNPAYQQSSEVVPNSSQQTEASTVTSTTAAPISLPSTVLPIENLFDKATFFKRSGQHPVPESNEKNPSESTSSQAVQEPAAPAPPKRKLKLVRKGQRAQWHLKLSQPEESRYERLPKVASLVAPAPGDYSADPLKNRAAEVSVISSSSAETRVCVQGKCQMVSGH